jgi:TrmH family RNA methyltransferase
MKPLSNPRHPIVQAFRDLAREPDPTGARLLLDGAHLVRDARTAGLALEAVVVAASAPPTSEEAGIARDLEADGVPVFTAGERVSSAISPVRSPSGLVAIARRAPTSPADVWARPDAFVLAPVDVQDPGNVGAMMRAGEAAGMTGVLVCGASASPYSWKSVRGSMGSIFRLPVATGGAADTALEALHAAGLRTVAAAPRGGLAPDDLDWRGRVALLLGGEGSGLSERILARADERVTIPMMAPVESLNVAVAAGILVYAARRQRQ